MCFPIFPPYKLITMLFQELNAQKKENVRVECDRDNRNDLLEYLRSLDANMVMTNKSLLDYLTLKLNYLSLILQLT